MRDEHLIYYDLPDAKILIRPKSGYSIYCTLSRETVSEAITVEKNIKYFKGVEGGEEYDTVTLDDALKSLRELGVSV